jgi:hypothetical protein
MSCCICRAPTWKRVVSSATTIGLLLLVGGCSFQHYPYEPGSTGGFAGADCVNDSGDHCETSTHSTGGATGSTGGASGSSGGALGTACPSDAGTICEPACTVETKVEGSYPSSLVAHWTFDGEGETWLDSDQGEHPLTLSPGAQDEDMRYSKTRINGKGNSLYLNGSQFAKYTGSVIDPLFPGSQPSQSSAADSGFTISAYVSIESLESGDAGTQSTHVMPVVSTMTSDTCGYQLDLRWNDSDSSMSLAFSYGYRAGSDASDGCHTNMLLSTLPESVTSGLRGWGMGRWHHIAGTYIKSGSGGSATLRLYWDGGRVANAVGEGAKAAPAIDYTDYQLYIGTNGDNTQEFNGNVDEVAIFNRPLSDAKLANFLSQSTTRPGPSQCRWTAREFWDKYAPDASMATWQIDSTVEKAHVLVDDNEFGAGALSAFIVPPKDLRLYGNMFLDATLQEGKAFAVQIANQGDFCQWLILGIAGRHTYPIDLSKPGVCYTSSCAFKLDSVDWISINSEWTIPVVNNPRPDNPARSPGPVDLSVHSVTFELSENLTSDWSDYGGAIGVNGWCWRPQSFDLMSGAEWARASRPSVGAVSATLIGRHDSSTRIGADFASNPYHLPSNACVLIDATTSIDTSLTDQTLAFVVDDLVGSWGSWDIIIPPSNSPSPCMMQLSDDKRYYSSTGHSPPYDAFPSSIDWNRIKSIGIQKPYYYDSSLKGSVEVTIRGITIYPDDGKNCSSYGVPASCRPK